MYLNLAVLIDRNNRITGLNNVKPCRCDKMHMDKDLIEDKLYQLIDHFNERKINHRGFYFVLTDDIHPFYDGNWRTCIIFVSILS